MHASGKEQSEPKTSADYEEGATEAFVIRLWLEEKVDENRPALWRGHITHVLSGTRRYFQELHIITDFIASTLQKR